MFEDDVAPIDVPEVSKTFKKSRVIRPFFISTTCMPENAHSGDSACLLRPGGERRGEENRPRASEERATVYHWIRPQAFCGCWLCGEWRHRVGSMA